MINLSNYPNLSTLANSLGGVRKAALNKKLLEKSEESWRKLTQDEVVILEQQVPYARKVMNAYVTQTAILYMTNHALFVIPSRDIIWIYGSITTMRMNFIPYSKNHNLFVVTRDGNSNNIGMTTTGGFSKKRPCDAAISELQSVLAPVKPGIFFGYSDQLANAVKSNFASVVAAVDQKNNLQQSNQMQYSQPVQNNGQQMQYSQPVQNNGQQMQYSQPVQNNGQPIQ